MEKQEGASNSLEKREAKIFIKKGGKARDVLNDRELGHDESVQNHQHSQKCPWGLLFNLLEHVLCSVLLSFFFLLLHKDSLSFNLHFHSISLSESFF